MLAEERKRTILSLLHQNGAVRTAALVELLGVSDQTIRRDFGELEKLGLVSKQHGGAVLLSYQSMPYGERAGLHRTAKEAIARRAAGFVKPGMTVALGPGTTTETLARALSGLEVRLVTNSLAVAAAVSHRPTEVHLTGGRYRPGSRLVTGAWAEGNLTDCFADLCFIGVSGIDPENGYTVTEADESLVLRQLIRVSKVSVVVSDATKFHRVAWARVAPLGAVHRLVTDEGIPPQSRQALEVAGVDVVITSEP